MTKATIIPSLTNNPPSRANPAAFPTDGDSFLNGLPGLVSGVNTVATELNTWNAEVETFKNQASSSQTNAANSSTASLTQARNAAASMVSLWVSGTTYSAGQIVYSNVDGREYKRITAGAGTTDPSSDTANWEPLGWEYITNYPDIRPTLDLNFAGSQAVDPRITFTRNSIATYFDKFGVMQTAGVNQPRIDFDPVTGECKGLLIEEQRTNLLTYSGTMSNASAWALERSTPTSTTTAPDGTNSAACFDAVGPTFALTRQGIASISGSYTLSVYAKALPNTANRYLFIGLINGSAGFDLVGGSVTMTASGAAASISAAGNGWYKCTVAFTASSATQQYFYFSNNPTDALSPAVGPACALWGAQLEAGAFATSYIPTTTAQVTRAADAASMTGTNFSSWYRQDEGTFFAKAVSMASSASSDGDFVEANDGTQANSFGTRAGISTGYQAGQLFSVASNGVSRARNGVLSSASQPTNPLPKTQMQIGVGRLYYRVPGWYQRVAYYPKRLPNATLQAITQP